jgi:predicted O-methyltransferase YrrM
MRRALHWATGANDPRGIAHMTSREVTPFWARADESIALSITDKAMVCLYATIQWPWLLKSLGGGRRSEKAALLERLRLPQDALPNLGSWKADTMFLAHIVDAIERLRPHFVVELGCGASSLVIGRALQLNGGGQLVSNDQHARFVAETRAWLTDHGISADIRHAPLGPPPTGWPGHWYQLDRLPAEIDMLVIDGPPWAIHPFVRGAAERLFSRLTSSAIVLLDDAARPGERIVARRWRRRWPGMAFHLDHRGTKGTLIGRNRP